MKTINLTDSQASKIIKLLGKETKDEILFNKISSLLLRPNLKIINGGKTYAKPTK